MPDLSDLIWRFSSWLLQSCQWPPDLVTWKTRHLELISRWTAAQMGCPKVKRTQQRQEHQAVPSHLPSWSLARRLLPSHPNTRYCFGIHVTLTEETGVVPPSSHTWIAPLVEDMCYIMPEQASPKPW